MKRLLDNVYFNCFLSFVWIFFSLYLFFSELNVNNNLNSLSFDKVFHFLDFFIMSYLILRTIKKSHIKYNFNSKIISLLFLIVFSIMIEYNQSFYSYRTFEIMDIIFNIFGIIASYFVKIK